jgi:DNA-binding protein HU-beta
MPYKAALRIKEIIPMASLSDIVDSLAASHNLPKAQVKATLDGAFAAILAHGKRGDEVSIAGFGKFKVKHTPEREGRNPATGKTIKIAAAKKMSFAPAKALKDALNG